MHVPFCGLAPADLWASKQELAMEGDWQASLAAEEAARQRAEDDTYRNKTNAQTIRTFVFQEHTVTRASMPKP